MTSKVDGDSKEKVFMSKRVLVVIVLLVCATVLLIKPPVARSDGNHDHDHGPKPIPGGGANADVTLLKVGDTVDIGPFDLKTLSTGSTRSKTYTRVVESIPKEPTKEAPWNLTVAGGEGFKGGVLKDAVETLPSKLKVKSPGFGKPFPIDRSKLFEIEWFPSDTPTDHVPQPRVQLIIEALVTEGGRDIVVGRIIAETLDKGRYALTPDVLSQLPAGAARVALKRIHARAAAYDSGTPDATITIFSVSSVTTPAQLN